MKPDDVESAWVASQAAFQALGDRWPPSRQSEPQRTRQAIERVRYLCERDPGGAFVAEERRRVVGVAQAIVRGSVWGLSLLAVEPAKQGSGIGRELLRAALGYARGTAGQIVLCSTDPRAMRSYARAGFALQPALSAFGFVRREALPARVAAREGDQGDREAVAGIDRAVRGAPHDGDIDKLLEVGGRLLMVEDRGYVIHQDGSPSLLAALDEATAVELLWGALAEAPLGHEVGVMFLTAGQGWAVKVALDAGLRLEHGGPTCVRGELGPLAPYLPNPAYL